LDYQAKQGDLVWLTFDPQLGREQKGRRPAFIASNNIFNNFTKQVALVCPITNTNRSIPIHVELNGHTKTTGVVMCDQAKMLDLKSRKATFIESAPTAVTSEVCDILIGMIE